jgi:hypothetical protein
VEAPAPASLCIPSTAVMESETGSGVASIGVGPEVSGFRLTSWKVNAALALETGAGVVSLEPGANTPAKIEDKNEDAGLD